MSSEIGKRIKLTLFGESHGAAVGMVMDNVPPGEKIDFEELNSFMLRRQGGRNAYSTPRKEEDRPEFLSGFAGERTTGAPICAIIRNENVRSEDYNTNVIRPGHADYTAFLRYNGANDARGGGHFSGRLTAPLCVAGGLLMQILKRHGISIYAHISSIDGISDTGLNRIEIDKKQIEALRRNEFPVIDEGLGEKMKKHILAAHADKDSVGGTVECVIYGFPAGIGDPIFDGIENRISQMVFGIGAVRGIEFGAGFSAASMRGSENNDEFVKQHGKIKTLTNNHGGVLGGISSGMPIVFNTAFKPTPSIGSLQKTVNLKDGAEVGIETGGRHDPCIVPRAVPCIEAAAALVISDFLMERNGYYGFSGLQKKD